MRTQVEKKNQNTLNGMLAAQSAYQLRKGRTVYGMTAQLSHHLVEGP